jgi:hypothetical protein
VGFFKRIRNLFRRKPKPIPESKPLPVEPQPEMPINIEPTISQVYREKRMMLTAEAKKWLWVREHGSNRGAEIEMFQREVDGKAVGEAWCLSFLQFCVNQVDRDYSKKYGKDPLPNWLYPTEHCLTLWNKTGVSSRITDDLYPGLILVWQYWENGKQTTRGHVGVIMEVLSDTDFITIEGNTADRKSVVREGDGVYMMRRTVSRNGNFRLKGFISPWKNVQSTALGV